MAVAADTFVVTDRMVGELMRLGFVVPLGANIPNLENLRADLSVVSDDPGRKYSLT